MSEVIRDSCLIVEQQIKAEGDALEKSYDQLRAKEMLQEESICGNKEYFEFLLSK